MAFGNLAQIRGREVVVATDPQEIESARADLHRGGFIRLPSLLDPPTLDRVRRELERAPLTENAHPGVGVEACFVFDATLGRLELQLNDRVVTELMARLADVPHIGCFRGRIYRVIPGRGHHDSFHDDHCEGRTLALTLNLSRETYRGSTLEIRAKGSTEVVRVPNTTPGDAVLFRIDPSYEHRISPIEGDAPKTALAGWFCTYPDFDERLRLRLASGKPDGRPVA